MHVKTLRDRKYLDHLRSEPCVFTGFRGTEYETVDPAHIGTGGKGIKGPDSEALPVLHSIHAEMHQRGEMTVVRERAPDWLLRAALRAYARELYEEWKR
ncbi:MAG: hypothetical protein VYB54_04830 [Pseudomonadota bacterium]|nr:hypothetical protein [Pseudomonadota bacterium]